MKLKTERASVSHARRFIQAKGWGIDHDEVFTIDDQGQKDRIPLGQFCRKYAGEIVAFIAGTRPARKAATVARLEQKVKGLEMPKIRTEKAR